MVQLLLLHRNLLYPLRIGVVRPLPLYHSLLRMLAFMRINAVKLNLIQESNVEHLPSPYLLQLFLLYHNLMRTPTPLKITKVKFNLSQKSSAEHLFLLYLQQLSVGQPFLLRNSLRQLARVELILLAFLRITAVKLNVIQKSNVEHPFLLHLLRLNTVRPLPLYHNLQTNAMHTLTSSNDA